MSRNYDHGYRAGAKSAGTGIIGNIILFLLKLFAGLAGRSQAMIADAVHTASDILTSLAVFIGFKIARTPADEHHPFGHGRAESIAAKVVAIILILVGIRIAFSSYLVMAYGRESEPGIIALIMAVVSLIAKEVLYRRVMSSAKEINSTSLRADALHHRSDALSSLAALIGIAGARMGYWFMDPLAGIVVAGFIIRTGAETFHRAYDELMDAAPPRDVVEKISGIICRVEGVREVRKILVRKAGIELLIEAIVGVDGRMSVSEGHAVADKVESHLLGEMPEVKDVMLHVEPAGSANDDPGTIC